MLQERRQSGQDRWSESCQEATYAVQQAAPLFEHLVGGDE